MSAGQQSKRVLSRERQVKALLRQGRAAEAEALRVREPRALVERDAAGQVVQLSETGLRLVERLARQGAPQSFIAASLGILQKQFKNLLNSNRGENDVRFAWEKGQGAYEFAMVKLLMKHGKNSFVPLIYLSKSRLGWLEDSKQAAAQIHNNVQLVLPKSRDRASYFAMLGVPDPKVTAGTDEMKTVEALPPPGLPAPDGQQSESQPVTTVEE